MTKHFLITAAMLTCSNVFMTFAWYGHLRALPNRHWAVAAIASWAVAQLKMMQEVITLSVFVPFSFLVMKEPLKLNYLWAALCLLGAVFFVFKD